MYYRLCFHHGDLFCMSQWFKGREAMVAAITKLGASAILDHVSVEGSKDFTPDPLVVSFQLLCDFMQGN